MHKPRDPILFISGAGLPPWIWDDVRQLIADPQDDKVATRPANGKEARLRDYAKAAIASAPPGRFTVVAHSAGGVIGAEAARLAPDRVSAFLAITAVIPKPAGSFIAAMPAPNRWMLSLAMRLAGTRPPASAIRRRLAHHLDNQTTARLIEDFTPESPALYRDKTTDSPWIPRRGYLHTAQDRELPLPLQRQSAQRLAPAWQDTLETGHLPMLEDPKALADAITRFLNTQP